MRQLFIIILIFSIHRIGYSQFYLQGGITLGHTNTFNWDDGKSIESNSTSIAHVSCAYLSPRKEKNNYATHGVELDMAVYSAADLSLSSINSTDFIQLSVLSNTYVPLLNATKDAPIFDINFGLGYGIAFPTYSTGNNNEGHLAYAHHHFNTKWGIIFYTSYDAKFEITYLGSFGFATSTFDNYPISTKPNKILLQGISLKFGGNISNLKKTLKALKEKRKQKT